MSFKKIFNLKLTGIISLILITISLVIFTISKSHIEKTFENSLKNTSIYIVNILLDSSKFDKNFTNKILNIYNPQILVLNEENEKLFEENNFTNEIKSNLLIEISNKESYKILKGDTLYLAFNYILKNKTYKIITSSININGLESLKILKLCLLIFIIFRLTFTYYTGKYFAKKTLLPIKNIIKQVENLNEINLNERLEIRDGKDEVALLAITFNQLLDRLENSLSLIHI
jgi:methyl-accepting chemotaxis protein